MHYSRCIPSFFATTLPVKSVVLRIDSAVKDNHNIYDSTSRQRKINLPNHPSTLSQHLFYIILCIFHAFYLLIKIKCVLLQCNKYIKFVEH